MRNEQTELSQTKRKYQEACEDCSIMLAHLKACELRCRDIMKLIGENKWGLAMVQFVRMNDYIRKVVKKPIETN